MYLLFQNLKDTVGAHAVARAAGDAQGVVDLNGVIALVIDVSGERQRLARAVVHAVTAALAADGVDLDLAHVDKPPCNMRGSRSLLGCFALCDLLGLDDRQHRRNDAENRSADTVKQDLVVACRARLINPVAKHGVHKHIRQVADEGRDCDGRRGDVRRDAELGLYGEVRALAQEHRNTHQKQEDHKHRAVRADRQDQENAQSNNAGGLAENLLFGNGLERLVGENAAKRAANQAAAIGTDRADARGNDGGHTEHIRAVRGQVAGHGGDGHIAPNQDGHDPHAGNLKCAQVIFEGDLAGFGVLFRLRAVSGFLRHQEQNQQTGDDRQAAHAGERALEAGDKVALAGDRHDADHDEAQQQGRKAVERLEDAVQTALLFVGARHADALHDGRPESKTAGQRHEQPDDDGHRVALIGKHKQEAEDRLAKDGGQQNRLRVELISDPAAGQVGDRECDRVIGHQRAELGVRAAHGGDHLIVEAGLHVRHDIHEAISDSECEQQQEALHIFRCIARVGHISFSPLIQFHSKFSVLFVVAGGMLLQFSRLLTSLVLPQAAV